MKDLYLVRVPDGPPYFALAGNCKGLFLLYKELQRKFLYSKNKQSTVISVK